MTKKAHDYPKTRKFRGLWYNRDFYANTKAQARRRAKNLRAQGKNAHIIKNRGFLGGYVVYARGKNPKHKRKG